MTMMIQHARRLHEGLRDGHAGQLRREPPRLPDAALDLLHALDEVRVAREQVGPGVDDGDDGLALEICVVVAHLLRARDVAHGIQLVGEEPAGGAQRRILRQRVAWGVEVAALLLLAVTTAAAAVVAATATATTAPLRLMTRRRARHRLLSTDVAGCATMGARGR
jgi:hypothetical protein